MNMNRELMEKSCYLREKILEMIYRAKTGHIGGDFSVLEILISLYYCQMNINPENMDDEERDRFVMSKGHSVEALYAVLADRGFFPMDEMIEKFSAFGSPYIGHPNNKLNGIEMNTGSLGHGLSVAAGMALAAKMRGKNYRTYVVMGDGEIAEGSVWEGFMAAGHYQLDNLCAVIDRNHLQISGTTEQVMSQSDLRKCLEGFGWNVVEAAGNDLDDLNHAFMVAKSYRSKPTAIIANTTKGYGVSFIENRAPWHHKVPTEQEYQAAYKELEERRAKYA